MNVTSCETFLKLSPSVPIIDVRSPGEYAHAHVPGALNLPLFSDAERAEIGTLYKHNGRNRAVMRGLELIGPRMASLAAEGQRIAPRGEIGVYCARGGMRSESVAWLLATAGLTVHRLAGGYKAYRHHVLEFLARPRTIIILSGRTGSGKTPVLAALAARGEQVLDLEALANHKGSAFGALGERPQPSTEHFENSIAAALAGGDPQRPVWIEDESRTIGACSIPGGLWEQMRIARVLAIDIPLPRRVASLVALYGEYPREELAHCMTKIAERLGGTRTREAVAAIESGDYARAAAISLEYYDKAYMHGQSKRPEGTVSWISFNDEEPEAIADALIRYCAGW